MSREKKGAELESPQSTTSVPWKPRLEKQELDGFTLYGALHEDASKTLGIDLDETGRQTYQEIFKTYAEEIDPRFEGRVEDMKTWHLKDHFVDCPPHIDIVKYMFVERAERVSKKPKPYENFKEVMRALKERGFHLVIVTSLFAPCVEHSLEWLDIHEIPYDAMLITPNKTIFSGVCLLDDALYNLEALKIKHEEQTLVILENNNGGEGSASILRPIPVCFDQGWNREQWKGHRVKGWLEFLKWVDTHLLLPPYTATTV